MIILQEERPRRCGYCLDEDFYNFSGEEFSMPICLHCKHSRVNTSYPKDEMDCRLTGGICNALCTCKLFEEDC